ncbi:protein kinase domain-containing protein, partial [Salmonella sp. s51228]|uniref:protein kinase domain-containing protein n=1 Tax=Salmonella sp. s51228 TaxID=3159652 RepID=UPI0039801F29
DVGSTLYIPPEVCLGEPTSAARDLWSAGVCIYLLLSGYFPFPETTQEEFIRVVCQVAHEFTSEFDNLPPNATLLITRLLQRNQEYRLTAKEALEHPWFQQVTK